MRLVTFRTSTNRGLRPGALVGEQVIDLGHALGHAVPHGRHWYDLDGKFLPAASSLCAALQADPHSADQLSHQGALLALGDVEIGPPVPQPSKLICIGLNYRDHAKETGMDIPERPVVFSKFSSAVVGPGEDVLIPRGSDQVDYEAELAVVIGRKAKHVDKENALHHVLGYMNFNDVSARDFQFADGQWQRGKSCDTFAPMGEFIATTDIISDPHQLRISLRLNGETMQDSNTDQLIFNVPELVSFLSQSITLMPGDVIATGTPPGVGFARKPPVFLKDGDIMEVEIEGLGVLRNAVRAAAETATATSSSAS